MLKLPLKITYNFADGEIFASFLSFSLASPHNFPPHLIST